MIAYRQPPAGEPLMIRRKGEHRLWVKPREGGGFDLVADGGGNITLAELEVIEDYVSGKPGGADLIASLERRMAR